MPRALPVKSWNVASSGAGFGVNVRDRRRAVAGRRVRRYQRGSPACSSVTLKSPVTIVGSAGGMLGQPAANDLARLDAGLLAAVVPVGVEKADLAVAVLRGRAA